MERNEEDWSVECSDDEKYEVDAKVRYLLNAHLVNYTFTICKYKFKVLILSHFPFN